jgi:serine/threonine protein kinase
MTKRSHAVKQNIDPDAPYAEILSQIGPATASAVDQLRRKLKAQPLMQSERLLPMLVDQLRGWPDEESAEVINAILLRLESGGTIDTDTLARWILVHDDAASVRDCLLLDPPPEIDVLRLLSRAGSQKLVFLAKWQLTQREVVLKKFIHSESMERIFSRELQPHPLSMSHPNIIETHMLKNDKGEPFLVERMLPRVLDDEWPSNGIQEAGNLLRDIASALAFLHERGLIHGDVKPDNIGYENGLYILLDFGICRTEDAFAEEATPTGSLRTRAPELLLSPAARHTKSCDVWALGATVFNSIVGRFPLFEGGEKPPRVSRPEDREEFLDVLRNRAESGWAKRVNCSSIPEPLRGIVESILSKDPSLRPEASRVVHIAEEQLSALLRHRAGPTIFSPAEKIEQLKRFLPQKDVLRLMPDDEKQTLREDLKHLGDAKGLTREQVNTLTSLQARLA